MTSQNTHNLQGSKRPLSPAGDKNSLCHVCARIDFDRYLVHKISRDISLGSWQRLVQSDSCAFCRLIVRSLRRYSNQALLHPSDQVILNNEPSWELGIEISPYDRLKSEAYSNKLDLRSRAKQCPDVAHRFIVSCENYPSRKAFLQYLAYSGQPREDRQFFGRTINRKQVDIDLLLSWLNRCDKWHEKVCEEDGIAGWRLPHELRLIDVKEMMIVMADPKEVGYLTLSYVWGTEEMEAHNGMKPTVTNRKNICTVNGEERTPLPKNLPRTIRDAILLTGCLGYRYLWVDALCIVQDDPQPKKIKHLDKMDAIYNCSEVTIVAGSGRHADSGLPGISIPRVSQYSEKVNGLRLGIMAPSFSELEASSSLIWNTRGWTFQEKILAKRILLFTEHQVYFRCSEAIWTEEIMMETEKLSKSIEARKAKYRWSADRPHYAPDGKSLMLKIVMPQLNVDDQWTYLGMFPDYASAVREYTQRTLAKPDDTLVAISGVFRTLQPDSGDFHYGLPSAYFLQALMWYPESGSRIIRTNRDLPSWTWAGWQVEKGVTYDVLDIRMLRAIMITLRKLCFGVGKALSVMTAPGASGDGSGSTSSSTSSYTDYGTSSSSAPPSSSATPAPWRPPKKPRTWSTISIVSQATLNMSSCFGWPLLVRDHTVKKMFLCADGQTTPLNCGETFALSTFVEDEIGSESSDAGSVDSTKSRAVNIDYKELQYHKKLSSKTDFPLLSMNTVIVKFLIGSCLHHTQPVGENESSVFELIDEDGLCVGEVWTTLETARRGREKPLTFITISWGLSMSVAEIAEEYIPRWTFDAAKLPEAKKLANWRSYATEAMELLSSSTKSPDRGPKDYFGTDNRNKGNKNRKSIEQPTAMAFFEALFKAKKGEPRPKFLWSTVNLVLVGKTEEVYQRIGVGRVIFKAWLNLLNSPQHVVLI